MDRFGALSLIEFRRSGLASPLFIFYYILLKNISTMYPNLLLIHSTELRNRDGYHFKPGDLKCWTNEASIAVGRFLLLLATLWSYFLTITRTLKVTLVVSVKISEYKRSICQHDYRFYSKLFIFFTSGLDDLDVNAKGINFPKIYHRRHLDIGEFLYK